MMKKLLVICLLTGLFSSYASANLLSNASFESDLTDWSTWNAGNIITPSGWGWAQDGDVMAGMWTAAAIWQDFDVTPGAAYSASIYAYEASTDPMAGGKYAQAKLEWYDTGGTKIGTEAWITTFGGTGSGMDTWTELASGDHVAPSGAASGRINVSIEGDGSGRVYWDNAIALDAVPEPGVMALISLGIGAFALALRRLKK